MIVESANCSKCFSTVQGFNEKRCSTVGCLGRCLLSFAVLRYHELTWPVNLIIDCTIIPVASSDDCLPFANG